MSEQVNMAARYEHEIPEGYEARIEGNKIILERKESEDEKIRKFIVETVFRSYGDSQEYLDVLAYLERQKEQKPIFKKGDKVIWQDEEFNILDVNGDSYNVGGYTLPFYRQNELNLIEQKSAEWSEEDEYAWKRLFAIVENWEAEVQSWTSNKEDIAKIKNMLNSLHPQPKENIEEKIDNFFDALGDCGYMQDEILKIKRLWKDAGLTMPQPKKQIPIKVWKPSEEQIDDLQMLLDDLNNLDNKNNVKMIKVFHWSENYKNLKGLLDNLKKL